MQLLKSKDISIGGHNKWAASKADSSNLFKYALYGGESNITFLSRGSISETIDHLICAREYEYINEIVFTELKNELIEIRKMLNGYINFLKKQKVKI